MRAYSSSNQKRAAPKAVAPPREEIGPDVDPRTGKKDWTRYNKTIVGACWDERAPLHPASLPGLAEATERALAAQAEWLATRKTYDYDDEEGWQKVKKRPTRRSRRPTITDYE